MYRSRLLVMEEVRRARKEDGEWLSEFHAALRVIKGFREKIEEGEMLSLGEEVQRELELLRKQNADWAAELDKANAKLVGLYEEVRVLRAMKWHLRPVFRYFEELRESAFDD